MSRPEHILVTETSALLSALVETTSGDALEHSPDPAAAIAALVACHPTSGEAVFDRMLIPGHVFYELTGLTAPCFPEMLGKLATARAQDREAKDPHHSRLRKVIDLYATASPRGETSASRGMPKQHIRTLLWLMALHPDTVQLLTDAHDVHHAYLQRVRADYSSLSVDGHAALADYRPRFTDAVKYCGDHFAIDALWVHAGQLRMMGVIEEEAFNKRITNHETANSRYRRFYAAREVIDMVAARLRAAGMSLPPGMMQRWREDADAGEMEGSKAAQRHLTLGFFRRHPEFLRAALLTRYPEAGFPPLCDTDPEGDAARCMQAIGASRMLLEHYIKSGLLPEDNASLVTMAGVLGLGDSGLDETCSHGVLSEQLKKQGFYEISPTIGQLKALAAAIGETGIAPPVCGLIHALERHPGSMRDEFNAACKGRNGLVYEKVFATALVGGLVDWEQFVAIVERSGSMQPRGHANRLATGSGDITIDRHHGKHASIRVAITGFQSRKGECLLHAAALHDRRENGHLTYTPDALLRKCRSPEPKAARYHRILEAMLYPAAEKDAARLRNIALEVLGEDRLLQVEKDYANREARYIMGRQPPFGNLLAALHTESRILRKNLGEAATLEAAADALQRNRHVEVWVANHDSDLYPKAGSIELEGPVVRQHAGLRPRLRHLNADMAGQERLHFLGTGHMLDGIYRLHGLQPPDAYDSFRAQHAITAHYDSAWSRRVADVLRSENEPQR